MSDLMDEEADLRENIAELGPVALAAFGRILLDREKLDALPRRLLEEPQTPAIRELETLVAMAGTDEVVRLRLLRAMRDLGALGG